MAISAWIPDRKVLAGGIAGVGSFFISRAFDLEAEAAAQISALVWVLVQYFVPASIMDVVNKIDGVVKKVGGNETMKVAEIKALAAKK